MSRRTAIALPSSRRFFFALLTLCIAATLAVGSMPPQQAEAATALEGTLEVVHEDHFRSGAAHHRYYLRSARGVTELLFAGAGPDTLGGRRVRVVGSPAGAGRLRVDSTDGVTDVGGDTSTTSSDTGTATDRRRVAVILFNFADNPTAAPITPTEADQLVLGAPTNGVTSHLSSNDYFFESSLGDFSFAGTPEPTSDDVYGWVTIPNKSTDSCDYKLWGAAARAEAAKLASRAFADGDYDHVVHIMPPSSCTFGGVAELPGKYTWVIAKPFGARTIPESVRLVTSHELGHNFNLWHSGSYRCTAKNKPVVLSSRCTLSNYGDPFSVMGNKGERHITAYQKGQLSWLDGTSETVSSGTRTVTLKPIEKTTTGVQSLRIPITGTSDYYYVEYRTSYGFDTFADTDTAHKGVLIRIAPDTSVGAYSKLLDATPTTDSFFDAAFLPGTSFSDSAMGLTVRVLSVDMTSEAATVEVSLTSSTKPGK